MNTTTDSSPPPVQQDHAVSPAKAKNPLLWVPTGYFTMALTYNLLTAGCVIMFSNLGMDNAKAAAYASALGLAYTIKPLFAAFMELYKTKKFIVLLTQVILGLGFIAIAAIMELPNYFTIMMALFWVLSFVGSALDITTDGVYVTSLDSKKQALYCGVQSLSWNMGKLGVMSLLVGLSGYLHEHVFKHDPHVSGPDWLSSWQFVFAILGFCMLVMAAWHYKFMPDGSRSENAAPTAKQAVATLADAFKTFFQKRDIWLMVAFALFFRVSYAFLNAPAVLFLKDGLDKGGLGLSNQDISIVYGTFGTAAMLVGSLIGGFYVARKGLQKTLFTLCLCVNVPNITFLLMAYYQPQSHVLIALGVVLEQFFFGIGAVGFMIYLMQQLAPGKYTTAHYAFGTALMSLCMMLAGMVSGQIQEWLGYTGYFVFVMAATIPSFLICWLAPFHVKHST